MKFGKNNEDKQKAAKEFVDLVHVDTKKQIVDKSDMADMLNVKKEFDAQAENVDTLTSDDRSLLSSFQKKRMMLDRLYIIMNQSRKMLGMELFKRDEIKEMLDSMVFSGYLDYKAIEYEGKTNEVYILTEKGEDEIL